ncbi:MAG: low specificity L-threonine aldolase [Chitinispirillaceae bacterium]|nr:low specificity L-threonine aldolase [Chitinispirillaceae bacterium]
MAASVQDPRYACFASDNYSGICPEALDALSKANAGFEFSYGDDQWTREACDLFRDIFETRCEVFFVFNGTAGNSLALASLCQSYHSVICHEFAHIETDECGAPEFFSHGAKLLLGNGREGKLTPESVARLVTRRSDIHYPKPKAVSVTQATEFGTVYAPAELRALNETARKYALRVHMDGARFANAVASLKVKPREIANDCGVDVLVLGGSKNGLAFGEAVIFFDVALASEFAYRCKQAGQLASKMRFMAAPWVGVLKTGAWLRHAEHANRHAEVLEQKLRGIPEVAVLMPRQANSVFVKISEEASARLKAMGWHYYTFIGAGGARLMCSWNTTEEMINLFIEDLKKSINKRK